MFNPNMITKILTTLVILPISLGTPAEASTPKNYGAHVGTCNEHGWIVSKGEVTISIGKSHDVQMTDGNETYYTGWTHEGNGTVRIHQHEGRPLLITPMCPGGGFRF